MNDDMIDAQHTRELLQKLTAQGHTVAHIAEVIGYSQSMLGQVLRGVKPRIRAWSAAELERCIADGMFAETDPPVDEVVLEQLAAGYDEYALDIRRGEKYVYARRLAERGLNRTRIADLLHASNRSVREWLDLHAIEAVTVLTARAIRPPTRLPRTAPLWRRP